MSAKYYPHGDICQARLGKRSLNGGKKKRKLK